MQRFDLSDVERFAHVDVLDEAARSCSVPFRARAADSRRPIVFRHLDRYFGPVNVTHTRLDNFYGSRSRAVARRDGEPRLILTMSDGPYTIEQNDRCDRSGAGAIVPYWSLAPMRLEATEEVEARSITVPLAALGLPHLFVRDVLMRNLATSPLGPLVSRYLRELSALPPISEHHARALTQPTIDLLRALLTTAGGDEFLSRQPLSRTLGVRVMLYLRDNVTDRSLTADALAAHFGISKRYLYAVLAQMGVSLGDWIRAERLDRAAQTLENPANALTSVAAVAHRSGFADHSTFSRAFRQRYGCTPSEWRLLTTTERANLRPNPLH
ncbi:AraC family transcriptional regulator [Cryptosporangium aurantiacum]|uniref:AraC-type DNA-binding protein n=1 Tax=Cryptosporangium aurantiacum TaxID=134849 RepID=A0A1M7QSZ7_9ACTN|nr:AraC family transcriptional regulator [Cryptosporangium aurantiacum]SHN34822.1 AraC-type DNA-binding protein [Cryptosporangium aurantiacum]